MKLKEQYQLSKHINLKEYDNYMKKEPLEQKIILDFIINKYSKNKSLKIIEFGAGTGRFTKLLLNVFPKLEITLIEPDKNCCIKLSELKKKGSKIKIVQSTAEDFKSNSKFDIVIMATAFHHIPFKNKSKFLKLIKKLLNKDGMFLCGDNFISEYKTMKERNKVLKKSIDKWMKEAKDKKELKMVQKMKAIVFEDDYGGEYFICPSKFESYIKNAGLKIKGKINVSNTSPFDFENYFYLIMK